MAKNYEFKDAYYEKLKEKLHQIDDVNVLKMSDKSLKLALGVDSFDILEKLLTKRYCLSKNKKHLAELVLNKGILTLKDDGLITYILNVCGRAPETKRGYCVLYPTSILTNKIKANILENIINRNLILCKNTSEIKSLLIKKYGLDENVVSDIYKIYELEKSVSKQKSAAEKII